MGRKIYAAFFASMLLTSWSFSQENGNLLKNSGFKFDRQGKLPDWRGNCAPVKGPGYKEPYSGCLKWKEGTANMLQTVNGLKPGKYIFSMYVKLDRKIRAILLLGIIKVNGKDVYLGRRIKAPEQPEPGVWDKLMTEFEIPEGVDTLVIALDFHEKSGGTAWLESPLLTYKAEQ